MRDAAGEDTQALELLSFAHLCFEPLVVDFGQFAARDVGVVLDAAAGVEPRRDRLAPVLEPPLFSLSLARYVAGEVLDVGVVLVRAKHPAVEVIRVREDPAEALPDELALIGADHLMAVDADEFLERAVHPRDVELSVENADSDG